MKDNITDLSNLEPGEWYEVSLSDCCVDVSFIDKFCRYDEGDIIFERITVHRAYDHAITYVNGTS